MNQMGFNIPYPYHSLPMKSTEDRLGYYAMLGILEQMVEGVPKQGTGVGKKPETVNITLNCGKPPT